MWIWRPRAEGLVLEPWRWAEKGSVDQKSPSLKPQAAGLR